MVKMLNNKKNELKARQKIYDYIDKNPGLHFREIARKVNMPYSTFRYHINYMIKHGILSHEFNNGYTRYFVVKNMGRNEKRIINILREPVPRNIILLLILWPYSSATEIMRFGIKWHNHQTKIGFHLDKHYTTLNFHLKKLVDEDILHSIQDGPEVRYIVNNPLEIINVIRKYEKSLLKEASGTYLTYIKNVNIDKIIKFCFDIFPIHFRC
jgi:DNA-binding transcriptional ArsR family regulator